MSDALLSGKAPLGWEHINLKGGYLWEAAPVFEADSYRLLAVIEFAAAA